MKYTVTVNGRDFGVVVEDGWLEVGGRGVRAQMHGDRLSPIRLVEVDGRYRQVVIESIRAGGAVRIGSEAYATRVTDERTRLLEEMTGPAEGTAAGEVIRAPMPGLVLRFLVEEGQQVPPGGGVAVLEAMKMENEIRAVRGGVVIRVLVQPGGAVEKGALLVEMG